MPIPQLQPLNQDADLEQVKNYVIRMERTLNFLLENGLDSENVFEVGGWRVGSDTLSSKDGDVGMTTAGTSGSSIRLWAGSTDPNTAPWRVTRDGTSYMTGAEIYNELSGGAYTSIGSNGITVNDGVMDTFRVDTTGKVTMTGAMIRSATGYPRVVMDPNDKLFAAELNATESIAIQANYFGAPSLNLTHSGVVVGRMNMVFGYPEIYGSGGIDLLTDNNGDIKLTAGGTGQVILNYADFSKFQNNTETLQDALDAKANYGVSTSMSGSHNHGISPGTQLAVVGGGFVTWVGASDHSHAQN